MPLRDSAACAIIAFLLYTQMAWTVEILNDVVTAELLALPDDMQARFQWIAHLIEARGLEQVHQPYLDHLDGSFGKSD